MNDRTRIGRARSSSVYAMAAVPLALLGAVGCSARAADPLPYFEPPRVNRGPVGEEQPGGPGGGTEESVATSCGRTLVAKSSETCVVVEPQAGGSFVLRGTVLSPSGPLDGGEVLVGEDGKILCAACDCSDQAAYALATKIDCARGVISPSLINTHDHIDYGGSPPQLPKTRRFEHRHEWRNPETGLAPYPRPASAAGYVVAAELRFVLGGATSTVSSGGQPGLLRNFGYTGSPSAAALEGLDARQGYYDTFPLGDSSRSSDSAPKECDAYRKPRPDAYSAPAYFPHIAEGINEGAERELDCLMSGDKDVVNERTGIIHAVGVSAEQAKRMGERKAKVIWSPRTNISLYGNTAPISLLKTAGVKIALGTDWLPSGSMNMLRELQCADFLNRTYFGAVYTDEEMWKMATVNAAEVVGAGAVLGQLSPGFTADIAVFSANGKAPYRAVLEAGNGEVALVVRGGRVLFGESAPVAALAFADDPCEKLSVCGADRTVCIDTPDTDLSKLTSLRDLYPLIACGSKAPPDEPTCTPYRSDYPDGTSAKDRDGDGIPDAEDNCPAIFNPPRPMDGDGRQADADGDGEGDACDATP